MNDRGTLGKLAYQTHMETCAPEGQEKKAWEDLGWEERERWASAAEEVKHALIEPDGKVGEAGAIFALMGWLTSRDEVAGPFSARHDANQAAQLAGQFCEMQGWEIKDEDWHRHIKPYTRDRAVYATIEQGTTEFLARILEDGKEPYYFVPAGNYSGIPMTSEMMLKRVVGTFFQGVQFISE